MIRVLLMIVIAGFVLSVGTLAAAVAIGGPEILSRGAWGVASSDWDGHGAGWGWHSHHHGHMGGWSSDHGPQSSRTLAWSGAQALDVGFPADIRYVQAEGPGTVTVSGPPSAVEHVVVSGESVHFDGFSQHWWPHKLSVVVRAPNISRFDLSGANGLTIEDYKQDKLALDISGAAEVNATGEAGAIDLEISGTGDVDLGGLKAKSADVKISGAGGATIAPTESADLQISGMGDVRLLTNPPKLETHISGAGRVRQPGGVTATAPNPATAAPPAPAKRT
ncbi:MAG TPA: DUF2807 domain-containing protein [Phenylobacterium sp.]|nr:DUF2807 domain-containing protein [Phenylobacterium sp.]